MCRDALRAYIGLGLLGRAENPTLPTLAGPCVVPVVERVLCKSNDWDFNVFELNDVSQGNPLSVLGFFLLKQVTTGLSPCFRCLRN